MRPCKSTTPNKSTGNCSDATIRRIHNQLLYITTAIVHLHETVGDGVPEKKFRALVKNYLNDPLSNSAKDATAILEILERKGLIGLGDYDILKDIVQFDKQLVDEINETENTLYSRGVHIYFRGINGFAEKPNEDDGDRGKKHVF